MAVAVCEEERAAGRGLLQLQRRVTLFGRRGGNPPQTTRIGSTHPHPHPPPHTPPPPTPPHTHTHKDPPPDCDHGPRGFPLPLDACLACFCSCTSSLSLSRHLGTVSWRCGGLTLTAVAVGLPVGAGLGSMSRQQSRFWSSLTYVVPSNTWWTPSSRQHTPRYVSALALALTGH